MSSLSHLTRRGISVTAARFAGSAALRDVSVLGSGALVSQVVLFLAAPVYLRLYLPANFGLYSFYYGLLSLVATLGTWKIERLIVVVHARLVAIRLLAALIWIALAAGMAVFAAMALVYAAFGQLWPPNIVPIVWAGPAWIIVLLMSTGLRFYCIRVGKFLAVAVSQVSRAIVFASGTIATAVMWRTQGSDGVVILLSWQMAADTCALLVQIGANPGTMRLILQRPHVRRSLAVLLSYRKTVGTLAISQIIGSVNQQIPISTVALAFGAVSAGWYSLAIAFVFAPCTIIASAVSDVANQRLSRLYAARKPFSRRVLQTIVIMAVAGIVPFAAMGLLAPLVISRILGAQWSGAASSIVVLIFASYLSFVATPTGNVALIVEARRYILIWHVLRMINLVVLGAAAMLGVMSYPTWLVLTVLGDSFLYVADIAFESVFARTAEAAWRKCKCV